MTPEAASARFGQLIENLREVVFLTDLDGNWTFLNPAWSEMLGYPVADAVGTAYIDYVHPDDRPDSQARFVSLVDGTKEECRAVFRMLHQGGDIRWVEVTSWMFRADDGSLVGMAGTLSDVTERVAAEAELERQRRRLFTVLDGSKVGIWERNEVDDHSWFSPGWWTMLGYEPGELDSTFATFQSLVHPDDVEQHQVAASPVLCGEAEYFESELRMRHKLGHWIWIRSRGRVMKWGPDGTATVSAGTHMEITEQVAAQEALRRAQKMESLGRIAGGIAHDFNNLLAVILGSVDVIDDPTNPSLAAIRSAGERAAALTRRLLDIAQQQPTAVDTVDPNAAIEHLSVLFARAVTPNIDVRYETADDVWPIEVDPGRLADAVLNLAINARDAMPAGGVLTVRTENRPGDRVAITVTDTGVGISADVAERIFEPFFSTKPAGQGTGLGLSLAYAFARQSGGDISVTSHPGGGTTFTLEFPRARPAAASPAETVLPAQPLRGQGELVLVVDDEGLLRELARAQLESAGYQVVTAADGPSALDCLAERPDIRLVFSDVLMPGGLTGVELAAEVRTRFPTTRVLLTSGFTARGAGSDFDGIVLRKPYTRADLVAAVRSALT